MESKPTYQRKVRFSDSDCQGHVFNANYFVYVDDAVTDHLEDLGLPYAEIVRRGHDMVLARAECDFRSPGCFGETLSVAVRTERLGNTSVTFGFVIREAGSGRTVCEGREVYVILDRQTGRPAPVPDHLRDAIAAREDQPAA